MQPHTEEQLTLPLGLAWFLVEYDETSIPEHRCIQVRRFGCRGVCRLTPRSAASGAPVPQCIIEFVQSRWLHSRTIVRSGFMRSVRLRMCFAPYLERSALS